METNILTFANSAVLDHEDRDKYFEIRKQYERETNIFKFFNNRSWSRTLAQHWLGGPVALLFT